MSEIYVTVSTHSATKPLKNIHLRINQEGINVRVVGLNESQKKKIKQWMQKDKKLLCEIMVASCKLGLILPGKTLTSS